MPIRLCPRRRRRSPHSTPKSATNKIMKWLWTWGGKSFGYRDGDDLWTHDGRHVGRFYGNEVYWGRGAYLGEIKSTDQLITNLAKQHWRRPNFMPWARRVAYAPYADYVGYAMYNGCEDFPRPSALRLCRMGIQPGPDRPIFKGSRAHPDARVGRCGAA